MISLEVNNQEYTFNKSITATISLDSVSGSFQFVSASDQITSYPISVGDECRVLVDGTSIIKGFIEIVEREYSTSSHVITISGRDNTADMIDSTLVKAVDLAPPITLVDLAEKVLSEAGIDISVSTEETLEPFGEGEVESGYVGQGVFDLIEQYARKRQVLLTSDGFGNVEFVRASGIDYGVEINNYIGGGEVNNVISGRSFEDNAERFYKYVVKSQTNVSAWPFGSTVSATDIVDKKNEDVLDSEIRTSRTLTIQAESASDDTQCKNRAEWERGVRNARSFGYTAIVQGHSTEQGIWRKNSLVDVTDEFANVTDKLLVESLTFRYSDTEGSTTEISCVRKEAYTLAEPVPVKVPTGLEFLR